MYEQLELGFAFEKPRQQSSNRRPDPYALEPWEKNTVEGEAEESTPKQYKTFYRVPASQPVARTAYSTQRIFSFAKEQNLASKHSQQLAKKHLQDRLSVATTQQSVVSHYNINGNFLTEPSPPKRKFSNRFFLRAKDKKSSKLESRQAELPVASLSEMKRRVGSQKQSSFQEELHFIKIASERQRPKKEEEVIG